jgi:hypothetical protein
VIRGENRGHDNKIITVETNYGMNNKEESHRSKAGREKRVVRMVIIITLIKALMIRWDYQKSGLEPTVRFRKM